MFHEQMSQAFVTYAAGILGDTSRGFSGSQIIEITAAYAVEFDIRLPHPGYPFSRPGINKRTALSENLMAFQSKDRYKIIKEMCDHPTILELQKEEARKLKVKLFTKYGNLSEERDPEGISETLVEQTRHWLEDFPASLQLFNGALQKQQHGVFHRNLLDDLRLALEQLLRSILTNEKSLENQLPALGQFLKAKNGSPEFVNMFCKLLDYYSKYQNSYVKHNDAVLEEEIEFIFEITASFMKHLVRLNSNDEG